MLSTPLLWRGLTNTMIFQNLNTTMNTQLNELHLFAGAGGGILGGMLCGHTTVCAVEIEPYCRKVLLQRQRDGILPKFPIWDDVRTFDGKPWRGLVDVVCGGFPCQDISCAGKGAGIEGSRSSMWKHMARVIGEVRPRYAFVENSPMLVGRGLSTVLADLAEMGYDAKWGIVGAHHVSAPHRRDRIWILATDSTQLQRDGINNNTGKLLEPKSIPELGNNSGADDISNSNLRGCDDGSDSQRQHKVNNTQIRQTAENQQSGSIWQHWTSSHGCDVAHTNGLRLEGHELQQTGVSPRPSEDVANSDSAQRKGMRCTSRSNQEYSDIMSRCSWWGQDPAEALESPVGRVANGVANRVDRLKAIGNGQVSSVAALAWSILKP